ncbi:MAG TPA: hypothetical protein VFF27_04500, partial [Bacteroidia bacterium]|nr:hypothetical protein [Bacteroidia bacterium]
MKKLTIILSVFIGIMSQNTFGNTPLKEVEFNWSSPSVIWSGEPLSIPCKELFYIKIGDLPKSIKEVKINIYETTGIRYSEIAKDNAQKTTFICVKKSETEYSALITKSLTFKRWYYVEVVVIDADNIEITKDAKAYALYQKDEASSLEFYGSIGMVAFTQNHFLGLQPNLGFATGLKIKLKPVSTNPKIGRFGLYPKASKWSLVIGTVINDLTYKSTDLKAPIFGLKPILGADFEISGNIGISCGGILVSQNTESKLSSRPNLSTGFWISLS